MAALEITNEMDVDLLVSLTNTNGFQMTACPILSKDSRILHDRTKVPAALPVSSLKVKDIRKFILKRPCIQYYWYLFKLVTISYAGSKRAYKSGENLEERDRLGCTSWIAIHNF
jgi:hypothetical protein